MDRHAVRTDVQEMLIHVVNAQVALGEARVEIIELQQQLADRGAQNAIEADLEMQAGGYFTRQSQEHKILYCPTCWGADRKLVSLIPYKNPGRFWCTLHKIDFTTPDYRPEPRRQQIVMGRLDRG